MHCPFCHNEDSRVVDTRIADDGASIRRRRECTACKRRFTTLETSSFQVVKRSGVVEPFSREKVVSGVRKACQGRPVSDHDLALLAQQVEEALRSTGVSSVSTAEVGKAILPFLSELDEIAYLRFASVYRGFNSLDDFEEAIGELRARDARAAAAPAEGSDDEPSGRDATDRGAGNPGDGAREEGTQGARRGTVDAQTTTEEAPQADAVSVARGAGAPGADSTVGGSTRKKRPARRRRVPKDDAPTLLDD